MQRASRSSRQVHPFGRRVWEALCHEASHKLADGSVTSRVLFTTTRGPLAGAFTASYCFLKGVNKVTRPPEVRRVGSSHLNRSRTTRKPSVNSLLPTTTRGGCSSVPTRPVVSAWPQLELSGLRLTKSVEASLTRSAHRDRESSTVAWPSRGLFACNARTWNCTVTNRCFSGSTRESLQLWFSSAQTALPSRLRCVQSVFCRSGRRLRCMAHKGMLHMSLVVKSSKVTFELLSVSFPKRLAYNSIGFAWMRYNFIA